MRKQFYYLSLFIGTLTILLGCSKDDDIMHPIVSANFSADTTTIFENQSINFSNESIGNPTSWQWSFEGGTPSTSNEQNPSITYTSEGIYSVTLVASNEGNTNEIIKENYIIVTDNLLNGLVGKFDLDGNGDDSSEFHNDGIMIGSVIPIQDRNGNNGSAMMFNEFDGHIDVGNVNELKLTSEISISVWVNANGNQYGWETIVNKWQDNPGYGAGGLGYYLGLNPNGLVLRWNVTNQIIEIDNPFPIDKWVHIVVTFDGQSLKLYINGNLENQVTAVGQLADNNVSFRIGQQSEILTGTNGFNGGIDNIYIYSRALTFNEIIELYNE